MKDASSQRRALGPLLLVVGASCCLGAAGASWAYHSLNAESSPRPTTTTVVRETPSVITAIRDLAVLEGASFHIERVVDLRDRQTRWFGMIKSEDALLLVAAGDVIAGVDLSSMRDGDVTFDALAKSATVLLPPVSVLSSRLDGERTYVYSRRTDMLAERSESLETRARQEGERTLRDAAVASGILQRAQANASRTIASLVRSLGYPQVEVRFREE